MSQTTLKAQLTQALDNLSDTDLQSVVEYIAFLKFRARHNPYHLTDEIAALYAEFADEDRMLAEEDMASYQDVLVREDGV